MAVCEDLLDRGYYAQGIRHPSVPRGRARLRITPMASHDESEIDGLADAIVDSIAERTAERTGERRGGSRGDRMANVPNANAAGLSE